MRSMRSDTKYHGRLEDVWNDYHEGSEKERERQGNQGSCAEKSNVKAIW